MITTEYDWSGELHKTMVSSLATTFGLDFLLMRDRDGGDVNTINNVRQGVYATDTESQRYAERGNYDSHEYHSHTNYVATNRKGKAAHVNGELKDAYTGKTFGAKDKKNLDHVVSAKEVHDDPGRVLAGLNGVDLANKDSNLRFTDETLNKSKNAHTMDAFTQRLEASRTQTLSDINKLKKKASLTHKEQKRLKSLEAKADADLDRMRQADSNARGKYNAEISRTYYTSGKFAKEVAYATANNSLLMGTRQVMGLVLAETWFEFRDIVPVMIKRHRNNFDAGLLVKEFGQTFTSIWERIKVRFADLIAIFKDGAVAGSLSSLTTTLFNVFFKTGTLMIKLIREMWNNLVQAVKLLVWNPDRLSRGKLMLAVAKCVTTGVAVAVGVLVNDALNKVLVFPLGAELAAFGGVLVTGLISMVLNYFLEYSSTMRKFVEWITEIFYRY